MKTKMKIVEANEGPKIGYEVNGTWLNIDDQISLNLAKLEADDDVHKDIYSDAFGNLETGGGLYYVAQVDIRARQYNETEIENPDYDEENAESASPTIIKREPVPFSMNNVTLTLFALKEGVFV